VRHPGVVRAAGVFGLVLMASTAARAQSAGSIAGTVKDSTGAALPGASVTVTNPAQGVAQTTQTGPRGEFVVLQLRSHGVGAGRS